MGIPNWNPSFLRVPGQEWQSSTRLVTLGAPEIPGNQDDGEATIC